MTTNGAQAQRTGLAWRRTAIGAVACALLLLHGEAVFPAVLAGSTAVLLAVAGRHRERQLSAAQPSAAGAVLAATASFAVAATAVTTLISGWDW
ncbi:protein of unknown function [Amycolatopsis xylanica]|uniref:Uncharacterized protein n=1 Tax=Amycolatopsis xylanica TaxID=589385 RepID=A0A1H3QX22_9PSEU|nr:DUF202 domain-containing protein [Amycolatopsis xylanica]SDZ17890.1 protein of unknown function [Amycolatopsis xylanica]